MPVSKHFTAFLRDQLDAFGPVDIRRMFSGAGLFRNGLMFALVIDDVLYLKSDTVNAAAFDAERLEPFSYPTRAGERKLTSYRRAPERCLDDAGEMCAWAGEAFAATMRADNARPASRRKYVAG